MIGDALYMVALPWLVLTTAGSAEELGMVLVAYGIPRAGSMLAGGWLSDRLRPRRLMLIADAVRLLLVGLLAVIAMGGHPTLWQLCAIAVPLGAFGGAFLPAMIALLPTWGIAFAVVCMLMAGVAGSIVNVVLFTAVQLAVPSHLIGRVMGLLLFSSFGVYPLSVALAGVLSNHLGLAIFFPFSGLLLALAMLFGMTQRALREI